MLQMVKEFRVDRTVVSTVQANNRCKDLQINYKVLQDQPKDRQAEKYVDASPNPVPKATN